MEINFDNLKKIDTILEKIEILEQKINSEKRWLNINEASNYLGYSKDHIHKLKDSYFIENKHYYKKSGRILFDKLELDNWVTTNQITIDIKNITDSILKAII
ncbi:helix-turn-helix domain-containing protein [Aliarcobacter butzleri]|uniref:helix-turn-helix domain-containing protein n=1 Tax=Aliarcobacter butzleri TaxID=28197 RepID=UPI000F49B657|nr:helix-turn-helix domain-containing protein [Aliarcobacter butzleri]MCT7573932.1 helix-turn-helix domain-containing protein [Aliarcobacter butzleri]